MIDETGKGAFEMSKKKQMRNCQEQAGRRKLERQREKRKS